MSIIPLFGEAHAQVWRPSHVPPAVPELSGAHGARQLPDNLKKRDI